MSLETVSLLQYVALAATLLLFFLVGYIIWSIHIIKAGLLYLTYMLNVVVEANQALLEGSETLLDALFEEGE